MLKVKEPALFLAITKHLAITYMFPEGQRAGSCLRRNKTFSLISIQIMSGSVRTIHELHLHFHFPDSQSSSSLVYISCPTKWEIQDIYIVQYPYCFPTKFLLALSISLIQFYEFLLYGKRERPVTFVYSFGYNVKNFINCEKRTICYFWSDE